MSEIQIQQLPVFPRGTFSAHTELFDRFQQNAAAHLRTKYAALWQSMPRYEEIIKWQMLQCPGVCAATHPGADNVFIDIMLGTNNYVYNSDCIYVNPHRKIYAVSDPPGITTGSRRLFEKFDGYIQQHSVKDNLQNTINRLNREMNPAEVATLSLLHLHQRRTFTAQSFVAGDTFLFHGNLPNRTLHLIKGQEYFIGTPYGEFIPVESHLQPGDFFLIASDGILSIKTEKTHGKLQEIILNYLESDWRTLVPRLMNAANAYCQETILDRAFGRFGGSDNISLLMVYPEEITDVDVEKSHILGGYLAERD